MSTNVTTNVNDFRSTGSTSEQTKFSAAAPTTNGLSTGETTFISSTGAFNASPGTAYRYDAATNKQLKYPASNGAPVNPALVPVLDWVTTPPTTPRDQDSYIVKATATGAWAGKENQIVTWSANESAWVFYTPATGDRTTLTSSGATTQTGTYEFDGTTWILIQAGVAIDPATVRSTYGNYGFTSQQWGNFSTAPYFRVGSDLVHFGAYNTANVTAHGDGSNNYALVQRMTYSFCNLVDGTYAPVTTTEPKFVDAATAGNYTVALDSNGKLWANGNIVTGTGITTTANSTTAVSRTPQYAFHPVPFFHANNITICKIGTSWQHVQTTNWNNVWALANNGDLYITGFNAYSQIGDGTTATRNGWFKWSGLDPIKKVVMSTYFTAALTTTGKLYYTGNDNVGGVACFGTGNKTTPFLATSSVADFEVGANILMVVKTDGTLWTGGLGTSGELGKGVTASSTLSAVPGITNAKTPVPSNARNTSAYIGTDNQIYFTGNNFSGSMGLSTTAMNTNRNTFAAANVNAVFQGTVVKAALASSAAVVMDSSGNIYTAGWNAYRGYGSNDTTTVATDANRWIRVALPEAATDFRWTDINADHIYVLCGAHGMYMFGGNTSNQSGWTTNQTAFNSPTYLPFNVVDDGTALSPVPTYVADQAGSLGTLTAITAVTDVIDGASSQNITFTVSFTGATPGVVALTSTATGADITSATQQTTSTVITGTSGTFTITFTVNAGDIAALSAPNQQAQLWTLVTNGTTLTSPSTASGNGWRITDQYIGFVNYPGVTHVQSWSTNNQQLSSSGSPGSPVTIGAYPGYTIQYNGNLGASGQAVTIAGPSTQIGNYAGYNGGGTVQLYGNMNSAGTVTTEAGATFNIGNPAAPTATSISATTGAMVIAGTVNLASQGWGSITSGWTINSGGVLNMLGSASISGDWRPFNNTIINNGTINVGSATNVNVVYQTWNQNGFSGTGNIVVYPGNALQLDVSAKPAVSSATQTITLKGMGANPYVGTFGNSQNNGDALFVDAVTNANNVANPVVLEALTSIGGSSPSSTAGGITGSISGPGGVYLSGYNGAWLTILGNNTYTGPTYIGNANSVAGQTGATGSVSFGGATGTAAGGSSQVIMNGAALTLSTAQTFKSLSSNTASGNLNMGTNALTISANGTTTVPNVITGSGAFNINGGTLNLTGVNTMSGTTTVASGAGIGGGSATTGKVAALTMSAAGSKLVVNAISASSASRLNCNAFTASSGFTVDVPTLNAGTYTILAATSRTATLPTVGANTSGLTATFAWSGNNLTMTLA